MMRAWLLGLAVVSCAWGCAHVAPASSEGVPAPWPSTDAPVERQTIEPYKPQPERETKPVVPPLKPAVPVPPEPNAPQSGAPQSVSPRTPTVPPASAQ